MDKIWFVYDKSLVSGPYTTTSLRDKLSAGELKTKSKVWWKGQRDWIDLADWIDNHADYESRINNGEEAVWYALKNGHHIGPSTKQELIGILSDLNNLNKIRVWKRGQEKWATVYQFNDISDELGITKRRHPRAPIIGEVILSQSGRQNSHIAASISEGGLGITGNSFLKVGTEIKLMLRSPLLVNAVSATAIVRHISDTYTGMEYLEIDDKFKEMISEYVAQFAAPGTQYLKNSA